MLYITYMQDGEKVKKGPFWSVSFDGCGFPIYQNWVAYKVQELNGYFHRIIIPTRYHSIIEYK